MRECPVRGKTRPAAGTAGAAQQQQAVNKLANYIENQELTNCDCHPVTMMTIINKYQNPVFVRQRVEGFVATYNADQKILAQAQKAQQAQQSSGCGFLGLGCVVHWVEQHKAAVLLGIGVALTIINGLQLGLDPLTDAAEGADLTALAGDTAASAEDAGADADTDVEVNCGESFTAGTKVLLATGAAIPIAQVRVGDKVRATNVRTGKTSAEPVTAVMVKRDTDRYDLRIRSGRDAAVIHTTRNHLFWDLTQHEWIKAGAFKYGEKLRVPTGTAPAVAARGWVPRHPEGWMWDLTVPGGHDHDFYIDVIHTAVLVHNCPTQNKPLPKWKQCIISVASALGIAHTAATGGMVLGNPPTSSYESEYRYPENPGGAPPEPGDGGSGGGQGGEGGC